MASIVLKAPQDFNMPRLRADVGSAGGEPQKAVGSPRKRGSLRLYEETQVPRGRSSLPKEPPSFWFSKKVHKSCR